ncbi:RNA polymerase sigma factor [Mycobacterium phage Miko]|nr:RNA polymerase sigma factor [Mycobacterium phage Miko]
MHDIFRRAARDALFAWKQDESGLEDLVNDIWVWYLESPETQRKLQAIEPHEAQKSVKNRALQILSGQMLNSNLFNGRNLYSAESVKDALKGRSTNRYLVDILPVALKELEEQNAKYAEALRKRYVDGIIPRGAASDELLHAHRSITEHVNVIAITAGVDAEGNLTEGPGSRHSVFPETRTSKGGDHSDPTADMALGLIYHGDDPIVLCAVEVAPTKKFGMVPQPVRDHNGDDVDSDQTTTLRKEFVA